MIRTLRILYLSRPAREKFLILALVAMAALFWLSSFSGRFGRFFTEASHTGQELKDQHMWLTNADRITRQANAEAARLDPSRTLDGPRLSTELSNLAQENNLTFHAVDPQDVPGGQFVIHSLQISITQASFDNLYAFYTKLEAQAPYISIEAFSIAANKANPQQLNANLRVSSVEIVRR